MRLGQGKAELSRRTILAAAAGTALTIDPLRGQSVVSGYDVTEIAAGIFVHEGRHELFAPHNAGDVANTSFVIGSDGVAVIDTGGSAAVGAALRAAIRQVTNRPIVYVINTHMHPDHVFGNAAFVGDAPTFVGHHKLERGLSARAERYIGINKELLGEAAFAGTRIIAPSRPVRDKLELDLGGRSLVLEAQPTAHTDNDLTVRDTATDTLFLGDLLFAEHIPTLDGSIKGWLALMDRLAGISARQVVPGHGPAAMDWPEAAKPLRRYLDRVASDVRALIKSGRTLSEATASAGLTEKDAWRLFEEYHARNVSAAFAELEWD
jgi:quinoprotein relay system zinc metallohydrolase 2